MRIAVAASTKVVEALAPARDGRAATVVEVVQDLCRGVSDVIDDQVPVQVLGGLQGAEVGVVLVDVQDAMVLVDPLDGVLSRPL